MLIKLTPRPLQVSLEFKSFEFNSWRVWSLTWYDNMYSSSKQKDEQNFENGLLLISSKLSS